MPFKFENLRVWQDAVKLADDVHLLTRKFPKEEIFNLTSQMKRATDSVSLNIAEGSTGQSNAENKKFLGYSIRSCTEIITCLYHAINRKYITQEEFTEYYDRVEVLFKMINKYRNSLK